MKKKQFLMRGYLIIGLSVSSLLALLFSLYYIQVINYRQFHEKAHLQHYTTVQSEMERGLIFDCKGKPLAISVEVDSVYAMPKKIKDPVRTAHKLKKIIKKDYRSIKKKLCKDCYFVWLARKVEPECSRAVRALNLEGIGFLKEYRRYCPQGNLAANLLGFVGIDNHGLEGLEKYYEDKISPSLRRWLVERDALGQKIILGEEKKSPSKPFNLTLTIDSTIQHIAEKELEKVFLKTRANGAHLVIMRPRTGEILALANRPTFNPNQFNEYSPPYWRNRAVTDIYEPGSSFKIISAAAALEENVVTPASKFFCENGSFKFYKRIIHDHEPKGWLTFGEIIKYSSNIGMIKVSLLLGTKKLSNYLRQFGFGERTGVDMLGEVRGILRPAKKWTKSSIAAIPYGQEISVTSLQLINAVSIVANGGLMMQPYVVKEIRDKKGTLIEKFYPSIKRRVISSRTAQVLTEILEAAVVSGTGQLAQVPGYRIAGKTGTAQKFDTSIGKYSNDKSTVSFVGFAPARNPAIVVLVMVDEPKGKAWGGTIAAPVFSRVMSKTLSYLQISPDKEEKEKIKGKPILLRKTASSEDSRKIVKIKENMPELKHLTMRESLIALSSFNLDIKIQGSGFLFSQRPLPGAKVNQGETCFLKFKPGY